MRLEESSKAQVHSQTDAPQTAQEDVGNASDDTSAWILQCVLKLPNQLRLQTLIPDSQQA